MKPIYSVLLTVFLILSCNVTQKVKNRSESMTAEQILGNPHYQAISYGGYRQKSRDIQPTISELKEDLKIMYAMGFRILRTYNVHLAEASNLLRAIREMKTENPHFEMYVMLGAWIDCKNAWSHLPVDHNQESENNEIEIQRAIELTNQYPEIVKVFAVGNEAMVKWASSYYVQPWIILKWVNHLQDFKKQGKLPKDLWITSSDNFASWGGGSDDYHIDDLKKLIQAVDYISLHTYPMHDTHYHPDFWGVKTSESSLSDREKIDATMMRARDYAIYQYNSVVRYMQSLGINKPVNLGETGWATQSSEHYGDTGSKATDEYKSAKYYKLMRDWSDTNKVTCFYFEAFDEQWKDAANPSGSENHFGLINLKSQAKYAIWDLVDKGVFKGLTRDGKPISKTFNGDEKLMWDSVKIPKTVESIKVYK
jgi:exo-beta-1,3-glucanase (GH17 family)